MHSKHMFVIWCCIRTKGEVLREKKTDLSPQPYPTSSVVFSTDLSKAVSLLQFVFVCASVVSYFFIVCSSFIIVLMPQELYFMFEDFVIFTYFFWCRHKF